MQCLYEKKTRKNVSACNSTHRQPLEITYRLNRIYCKLSNFLRRGTQIYNGEIEEQHKNYDTDKTLSQWGVEPISIWNNVIRS